MIATVLSVIAIIVSIIVAIKENRLQTDLNRINLESEYFNDIYKEHLIYKIPKARGYITFDASGKLIGTDKLIEELQQLRQDSLYFHYNKRDFYNKLKEEIQTLEDYLVKSADKQFVGEDYENIFRYITECINVIYKTISDGYLGKNK